MRGNDQELIQHKVVFVGNSAVGKTSIINQYMYDSVSNDHEPTVGIDFFAKTLHLEDRNIRMQIWDTAGQEKFRSLIPSYIRDSTVAVFVFDITQHQTFDDLEKWVKMVMDVSDPQFVIVGNKCDLEAKREVTKDEILKFAESKCAKYIETSAVTPTNIKELFHIVAMIPPSDSHVVPPESVDKSSQRSEEAASQTTPLAPSIDLTKPNAPQNGGGCSC